MVELEPQPEQQATLQHTRRNARVADGAEQDRVVAANLLQHGVRQRLPRRMPTLRAEVELGASEGEVVVAATVSSTARAWAVTSGPMPSPGTTASENDWLVMASS